MGRELLGTLATRIIHDDGRSAAHRRRSCSGTRSHVPFTDAWWQFPIFYPAARRAGVLGAPARRQRDLLRRSDWLTGELGRGRVEPDVARHVSVVRAGGVRAGPPPDAAAAWPRSSPGSSTGSARTGWDSWRTCRCWRVQWAPMAILALHLYLETRATRWLALFGAAWLLQALSNGYALFFLSVFVGLWMLWFVVLQRQWQTAVSIALAMAVASVPLAPILSNTWRCTHETGSRAAPPEVRAFSADAMGLLCARRSRSAPGAGCARPACPRESCSLALITGLLFVAGFLLLRRSQTRRRRGAIVAGSWRCACWRSPSPRCSSRRRWPSPSADRGTWSWGRFPRMPPPRHARSCSPLWRWRFRSSSSPGFAARLRELVAARVLSDRHAGDVVGARWDRTPRWAAKHRRCQARSRC